LIDASALDSLQSINLRLSDAGLQLHLCEVKGPEMNRLLKTAFLRNFSGNVFLNTFDA
jgi:SulP family sulfate permease|tara:strand:+ start:7174 stop:7347 length:174 start_codon:yes stop_codon:yes gene_type:complete